MKKRILQLRKPWDRGEQKEGTESGENEISGIKKRSTR